MPRKGRHALKMPHAVDPELNRQGGPPFFQSPYGYAYVDLTNRWIFERLPLFAREDLDAAITIYKQKRRELRSHGVTMIRFVDLNHSTLRGV